MTVKELLSRAVNDGVRLLAEDEGKALITRFGVAVPSGRRVLTVVEAMAAGRELGYPLVVKALVPDLAHKTDLGAVKLGIQDEADLVTTVQELNLLFPGAPLLVETMAGLGVELIVGLTDDRQFGPCLMIGMGGVLTEVFEDVQFVLLPATRGDLLHALPALKGYRLLTGFRGAAAADIDGVLDALQGVAQFGMEAAGFYEAVDVNPLLANADGAIALDVKVMLKSEIAQARAVEYPAGTAQFAGFFAPGSVAIVGASATLGKPGNTVIANIQANGYLGELYPVNPRGGEILGLPVYRSVGDLPEGVDLAIIIVPAKDTATASGVLFARASSSRTTVRSGMGVAVSFQVRPCSRCSSSVSRHSWESFT